jgi:hypothetical protein
VIAIIKIVGDNDLVLSYTSQFLERLWFNYGINALTALTIFLALAIASSESFDE